MTNTLIPFPGEFGRHFDTSTGIHCWDGHDLDFDVWAYDNGDGSFEVVVQQMLPNEMRAPGHSTIWTAHVVDGDDIVFQENNTVILPPTAPRVVFESIPQALQDQVWDAACEGFVFPDGREHHYDRTTRTWVPVD